MVLVRMAHGGGLKLGLTTLLGCDNSTSWVLWRKYSKTVKGPTMKANFSVPVNNRSVTVSRTFLKKNFKHKNSRKVQWYRVLQTYRVYIILESCQASKKSKTLSSNKNIPSLFMVNLLFVCEDSWKTWMFTSFGKHECRKQASLSLDEGYMVY